MTGKKISELEDIDELGVDVPVISNGNNYKIHLEEITSEDVDNICV